MIICHSVSMVGTDICSSGEVFIGKDSAARAVETLWQTDVMSWLGIPRTLHPISSNFYNNILITNQIIPKTCSLSWK